MKVARNIIKNLAFAACLLMANSSLAGTTRLVTTLADSGPGSLRAILEASFNGDVVDCQGLNGKITLTSGALTNGRPVTILGPGPLLLTISAHGYSRVFNILPAATGTVISGLGIFGGVAQGAAGNASAGHADGFPGQGGGIFNSGILTLTNCQIINNSAQGGDGDRLSGSGAGAEGEGGGVFSSGTLTLVNCLFERNGANGGNPGGVGPGGHAFGGGIFSQGSLALTNCTLSDNAAKGGDAGAATASQGGGGGIYVVAGSLVNCTLANNFTIGGWNDLGKAGTGSGGGIYVASAPVTLISCTISGNRSQGGDNSGGLGGGDGLGGGVFGNAAPTVENTIVSGNIVVGGYGPLQSGSTMGPDVFSSVTSGGFNFIGLTDESTGWIDSGPGMDLTGSVATTQLDPQLGQLQDNGGPVPTMLLMSTSGAIDNGNSFNIGTDALGAPRPLPCWNITPVVTGGDRSDIGAVEFYPPHVKINIRPSAEKGTMVLTYPNTSPGTGAQTGVPIYVPQKSAVPGGPDEPVVTPDNPVRTVNDGFLVTHQFAGGSTAAFFGLYGPMANVPVVPPPQTTAASAVGNTTATLNGTDTPTANHNNHTMYWFVYSTGSILLGLNTPHTPLANSTSQANLSASISGLLPGALYAFELVVEDDDAGRQLGGVQHFTTANNPPDVGTSNATSVTSTSATLNGGVNPEGDPAAFAYFQWSEGDMSYGNSTTPRFHPGGPPYSVQPFNFTLTGLNSLKTYHYRAVAANSGGVVNGLDQTFTTPWAPVPPLPQTPGSSLAPPGPTVAVNTPFTWTGDNNAAAYGLYLTNGAGQIVYSVTTLTASPLSSLPPGTLQPATPYGWYMSAFNAVGEESAHSTPFYFQTLPLPPAAETTTATAVGQTTVTLNGMVNPNGGETTASFDYGIAPGNLNTPVGSMDIGNGTGPQNFNFPLTGLHRKTQYYYRISATNPGGTTHSTVVLSFTTL